VIDDARTLRQMAGLVAASECQGMAELPERVEHHVRAVAGHDVQIDVR